MNLQFLENLLRASGRVLMEGFGSLADYTVKESQSSIVTEYDIKTEDTIRNLIKKRYPSHNLIGEENGFEDKGSEFTWIIDPLDGTSNFAAALPWFGVLIALLQGDQPILSGAYLPVSDELYLAEIGKGAFKNGEKISVSSESDLKNILCCYSIDFSEDPEKTGHEVQIIKSLVRNCRNIRSTNCLVDHCYTADGRFGAAMNQTMKVWDIAAPYLILKEAEGAISDFQGNELQFTISDKLLHQNYTAIAANPAVHSSLVDLITEQTI